MAKRRFIDAPDWLRCTAQITLKDGSHAQCGRYYNRRYAENISFQHHCCTQHAEMVFAGKPVIHFHSGRQLQLIKRVTPEN